MITSEQRAARRLGIGGSDIAIILGLSTYKTPYQLYLEKIGESNGDDTQNDLQYWGNQLEEVVRNEYAKRHNVVVETPETLVHQDYSFLRANIDGFVRANNAVLEVKCASSFAAGQWGESGSDTIPMPYLLQVAHYCAVTNADYADIAVLIGGNDYREYRYLRNAELETYVITTAKQFWDCIQSKTAPEPISQVDLRLMYPQHDPAKTKTINNTLAEQLTTLTETRFKIKELSAIEDKHKFNIMQFMKDAECLVNESGQPIVSWKADKRGSRIFRLKGV
jgi:putative phage-type endonuclease